MGDVISSHLDESRRQYISERTGKLLAEFGKLYEEQYGVALFNSVRYEIEGNGGPQTQLLHRKVPNIDKVIFSGNLFQYLDDTKKWRNRFCLVPNHYGPLLYENKIAYERGLQPRAGINSAGYKVFTSLDQYTEMLNNTVPGAKVKAGSATMKCPTQFPVILWHPYCRHYHFCFMTEREQQRWSAVFQDCVRHSNNGIPEDARVEAAAFTDSVRLYRQERDQYGTWDMLCGNQVQVLSNLVMDDLLPDLKNIIGPKLRGKPQDRQRAWLLISDTVYRMVHEKARLFYEGLEKKCGDRRAEMESQIRTDMDQIIACKEHVSNKIRAAVLPKAELCVRNHVQSHIPSILEALMVPTSQGFAEVRELVFTEATEMNKNLVNEGGREKLGEHMEKISQLAYHPVKMQQCYEKMDHLNLEGLQQRFDVGGPSVFKQRAQILMREQIDNAVYTFEQLIHQELNKTEGTENLCRDIQRILERVLKKYDYDSSTVRKKFFQEALLQIIIPFLLKKLAPTCKSELPRYQELIFEELSRFVLLENIYEEVVLQTVMRDIVQAVKDAATQRKHNLYRDSMVLHNSDPNLHLLGEGPPINWTDEYGDSTEKAGDRHGRVRQVVSIIQDDEAPDYLESCQEAPANENIPEEPGSSDVHAIRNMLVKEFDVEVPAKDNADTSSRVEPDEEVTRAVQEKPAEPQESHTEEDTSPHEHHEDTLDYSHAEASPEHKIPVVDHNHAEASPEHKIPVVDHNHAEASPEHKIPVVDHNHAEASPEHKISVVDHSTAEASPENEKPVYRSATDILKDVHAKQLERSQSTSDHLVKDQQQDRASPEHNEIEEEEDHRVREIIHPPTTQEATSSLVTPTEESQAQPLPSPVTHTVHSTPDDSGFQSPLSEEEEEGEGYKEVPVPAPRKRDEVITQF
ncbi:protein Niban 2 [Hyla sarda]|uniref:protein Niban 2 n=1 Tax=Hyla sarda TaxID=327740 RepID=UPI0024C24A65|nr:protein Niban 2 [Hyla sarda]XP_056396591.1 protein Niban 2 [Hyla sarda]XP_056396592.1 protein Niban 2 [Hyla sarda]XP_056396593.1 protein Niban 2 [Hyla sarda]